MGCGLSKVGYFSALGATGLRAKLFGRRLQRVRCAVYVAVDGIGGSAAVFAGCVLNLRGSVGKTVLDRCRAAVRGGVDRIVSSCHNSFSKVPAATLRAGKRLTTSGGEVLQSYRYSRS